MWLWPSEATLLQLRLARARPGCGHWASKICESWGLGRGETNGIYLASCQLDIFVTPHVASLQRPWRGLGDKRRPSLGLWSLGDV
ncbi:hypothetical protein B0H13DRAFT_830143 [Mycena leptocephala]|nr:hypothetical protein B0H13DRAFT_830143 [Mycena leptocephala]